MPPIPPRAYPNVCFTPLISWSSMWPSMSAVPGVRVALREPRQLPMVAVRVVPEEDRIPVGEGQEELRVERMDFVPETREIEVADDLGPQESRGVSESGESDPGEHLFGDGRAAD